MERCLTISNCFGIVSPVIVLRMLVGRAAEEGNFREGVPFFICGRRQKYMDKPFKTYAELINKLRDEKELTIPPEDEEKATRLLKKYSYFSLVSGYKGLFKKADGTYIADTHIDDILALYEFDDTLRDEFFHAIQIVEKHVKSLLSYSFVARYGDEQTAYLSPANYDAKPTTADFSTRQREIKKLISALSSIAIPPSDHEYIRHQWDNHDNVPLWAAVKVLTLGNISKMYSLCTESIQIEVAKEFPKVTSEAMVGMLDMLTRVRNVCAHSERLYDFSVKRSRAILDMPAHATLGIAKSKSGLYNQGKKDLFASLICLKYLLEQDEFDEVVMSIDAALCKLHSKTKVLPPNKILSCMGFPENWVDIREC